MTISKISQQDYLNFAIFSSIWIFSGWIAYLSALGDFFYSWIILGFFLLMLAVILRQIFLKRMPLKISSEFAIILFGVLIFVVILSFFVTPTIFSGRDQGALSEAAIRLSQNHRLEFSTPASEAFFKIYGPGKALNFPGFYYSSHGELTTQFPIVYISWLGNFYSFLGLNGLIVANAVLFFLFLISFYLLSRIFLSFKYSAILLAFTATSFPFFWFFKFTLSENMALPLLWMGILWMVLFIKEQKLFYYFSFLLSGGLLVFERIEGIFLLISGFIIIYFFTRKNNLWKEKKKLVLIYPAVFLFILIALNFAKDFSFFKEIGKAFVVSDRDVSENSSLVQKLFNPTIFELKIFYLYGILSIFLLGFFSVIYFWKKNKWDFLVPFFVVSPTLIYLFDPFISEDHPWMLRRFVFSLLPAFIFYSFLFLEKWCEEKKILLRKIVFYAFFISIFSSNIFLFVQYFPFSENKNLLAEIETISRNFESNDLVLVDRLASGDGWSMITGPMSFLFGKNAVYIFNPQDIGKIDRSRFSKIYLIAPEENISLYSSALDKNNLIYLKDYSIQTERLSSGGKNSLALPEKLSYDVQGKIFEILP